MTFTGIVKSFGGALRTVTSFLQPFEPAIALAGPYGSLFDAVLNGVIAAEVLVPAEGQGPAKKTIVTTTVNASLVTPVQAADLSKAIDQTVAALNALQAVAEEINKTAAAGKGGT